jgi:GAF domain-containing protein
MPEMSDPEEASTYLARTNFKSVIEWLTAEAILNRPDDPLTFVRDLVDLKLHERGQEAYDAAHATKYVQSCYSDAASLADEHGRIYGKVVAPPGGIRGPAAEALNHRISTLERLVKASTVIRALNPDDACERIISEGCELLRADRASIFTTAESAEGETKMLELHVAEGADMIRVPYGVGIAGTVAATGAVCNIHDAYNDSRFNSAADKESGYRTQNILCGPIKDLNGEIVGVLQMINKAEGPFNADDEETLAMLSSLAGVALQNAFFHERTLEASRRAEATVALVQGLYENMGVNPVVFTLTNRLPEVVQCDRCTIFVLDKGNDEMWAMQGEVNFKIPLASPGIAPSCGRDNAIINIPDAYADARFNQNIDKQTNYCTKTILCMPIASDHGKNVVGVAQLINKKRGIFTKDDEKLLSVFLSIVGEIMKGLVMSRVSVKKKATRTTMAANSSPAATGKKGSEMAETLEAFGEEEEEEEEEEG